MTQSIRPKQCKKCGKLIITGEHYRKLRKGKALCYKCILKERNKSKTIMGKFLRWLGSHGE